MKKNITVIFAFSMEKSPSSCQEYEQTKTTIVVLPFSLFFSFLGFYIISKEEFIVKFIIFSLSVLGFGLGSCKAALSLEPHPNLFCFSYL
jgi:hypothetical protein